MEKSATHLRKFCGPQAKDVQKVVIRFLDILFSLVLILILLPVFFLVSSLIYVTMGSPIFFIQERYSTGKKIFNVIKFRTMLNVPLPNDADFEKVNNNEAAVKVKNDPRITRVGSVLRKASLDEIPQLFNILAGSMSFVGPRPFMIEECADFSDEWLRRLETKPGLTGLAQINGRDELSMEEIVKYDLQWNKSYSLKSYFKILLKTVPYML